MKGYGGMPIDIYTELTSSRKCCPELFIVIQEIFFNIIGTDCFSLGRYVSVTACES
jgi:hypothetical protein